VDTEVARQNDRESVQKNNQESVPVAPNPREHQLTLFDATLTESEDRQAHAREIAQSRELSSELNQNVELAEGIDSASKTQGRFSLGQVAKYAAVGLGTAAVSLIGYELVKQGMAENIAKWVINDGIVFLSCVGLAFATALGGSSSQKRDSSIKDDTSTE